MTDASLDLLVVTPAGAVWDDSIAPDAAGSVSTNAILLKLYELIACSAVNVVRLAPDIDMWVDDEGDLKPELRVNQLASYIATRFGYPFQLYVGVVVFSGGVDRRGDTTSLSGAARDVLTTLIAELRSTP